MELPAEFVRHNQVDRDWLAALPRLLESLARWWSIAVDPPFNGICINYVAPATRADGTRCVVKLSRHIEETQNEIAALRLWDGRGAARLLEEDAQRGALLLERIEPGDMLSRLSETDDDAATLIAARVLRELWRPLTEPHGLRSLASWCAGYERNRAALSGGAGGFPAGLFQRADTLRCELLDSTEEAVALHGDLHHFNDLRSDQHQPWRAIDPKGLHGDRCFDVCQFFRNPGPVPAEVNRRRLDIFCAELDLDRRRTKDWCLVHAVLDACWQFEDGEPWQETVAYAEATTTW